jgi:uncharacterized protein YoxC
MPPKNYSNITVRREVREELERLREELKVRDFSDLLVLLVKTYREYTSVTSKLLEQVTSISSKVDELLTRVSSIATSNSSTSTSGGAQATSASSSVDTRQHATKSSKKRAIEILRERKVRCVSEMRGARNPEAVIESMKREGAVVVRTEGDTCAVDPEFWDEFKRRLNEVKSPNDEEVLSKLRDERMKRLFQLLRRAGALYLDNKSKSWAYDYAFIEEPSKTEEAEEVEALE